jgi:hypothetical protein
VTPRRRSYYGRLVVYVLLTLIFACYGFEAIVHGTPTRYQTGAIYPELWWQIMFPVAAIYTALQIPPGRPPVVVEYGWLLFGTITAFSRAAQLIAFAEPNGQQYAYGSLFWILVGANIVVALDHRLAYRDRDAA